MAQSFDTARVSSGRKHLRLSFRTVLDSGRVGRCLARVPDAEADFRY